MASRPNVLPIFPEPDGKCSAAAIAAAIRKAKYAEGLTNAELGFELRCDASTIENAEAERNLLKFDTVARLLRRYPEHCASIRQLWELEPIEHLTSEEHLARAQHHIDQARNYQEPRPRVTA